MCDTNKPDIIIHTIGAAALLDQLQQINKDRLARATQSFLICTATIARRKAEIEKRQRCGEECADLVRMIIRLEDSMRAHRAIVDELTPGKDTS